MGLNLLTTSWRGIGKSFRKQGWWWFNPFHASSNVIVICEMWPSGQSILWGFFYVHGLLWCTAFPFFRAYLSVKQELFIFPWPVSCPSEGSQKVNSKLTLNYNQDSIWCGEAKNCIWFQKIGEDSFNSPVKGSHTGRVNLIFREKLNNFI